MTSECHAYDTLACMLRNSKLKGFNIPGMDDKILSKLFADDAIVYLSWLDKFTDLKFILDKWCSASTAKFNMEKTIVIPIGSEAHRLTVIESRCQNLIYPPFPDNIHILQDKEATRYLGGWIGNHADECTPWTPIIEKLI